MELIKSLFYQNDIQGLEIKAKDDKWIPLHFPPSSFVVLAGDIVTKSNQKKLLITYFNFIFINKRTFLVLCLWRLDKIET